MAARSATVGWYGVQLSSCTTRGAGGGESASGGGGPTAEPSLGLMLMMRIGMSITAGSSGGGRGAATVTAGTTDGGGAESRPPSEAGSFGRVTSSSGMRRVVRPRRRPGDESRAPDREAGGGSLSVSEGVDGTGATSVVVDSGPSTGGTPAAGSSGLGAGAARRSSLTRPPSCA